MPSTSRDVAQVKSRLLALREKTRTNKPGVPKKTVFRNPQRVLSVQVIARKLGVTPEQVVDAAYRTNGNLLDYSGGGFTMKAGNVDTILPEIEKLKKKERRT